MHIPLYKKHNLPLQEIHFFYPTRLAISSNLVLTEALRGQAPHQYKCSLFTSGNGATVSKVQKSIYEIENLRISN